MRRLGVIVALGTLLGMLGGVVAASPALSRARCVSERVRQCGPSRIPAEDPNSARPGRGQAASIGETIC